MTGLRASSVADRSCLTVKHCVLVWLLLQLLSTAFAQPQQQAAQINSVSTGTAARTYAACEPGDNCQEEHSPWAAPATRSGCPHGYGFSPEAYEETTQAASSTLLESGLKSSQVAPGGKRASERHLRNPTPASAPGHKPPPPSTTAKAHKSSPTSTTSKGSNSHSTDKKGSQHSHAPPSYTQAERIGATDAGQDAGSGSDTYEQLPEELPLETLPERQTDYGPDRVLDTAEEDEDERMPPPPPGSCRLCPSGYFSAGGFSPCLPCGLPPGQAYDHRRQSDYAELTAGFMTPRGADRPEVCRCRAGFAGRACKKCDAGFFSQGGHSASCESCGPNQVSTASRDGCACKAGWGLGADSQCRVCPVGFWSSSHGGDGDYGRGGDMLRPCTRCSELFSDAMATTLSEGASSPSQCVCQLGYGGEHCSICQPGFWSPGGNQQEPRKACQRCPSSQVGGALPGARSISECGRQGCRAGFGGQGGQCSKCPPGTWSPGGSFDACMECGQFQTSAWGSTKSDDCWCLSGFFANSTNGTSICSPCPLGTFREAPEADEQPYASYSGPGVAAKTQWSLTGDRDDDSDGGGDVSRSSCTPCSSMFPGGVTTLLTSSKSARACVCAPGYCGPDCGEAPPGTYSPGGTADESHPACRQCPDTREGSQEPGASSFAECGPCKPGFGGPACDECPANTYSEDGECVECGFQQVSPPGSPDSRWCQCRAGYGGSDSCAQCPKGSFWPEPKDDDFAQDGSDSYGASKASSQTEAGIQSANQTARLQAKTAQYSSPSSSPPGVQPCISCSDIFGGGVHTLSVGAISMHECACLPGYGGDECSICPPGEWSPGGSEEEPRPDCQRCPENHLGSQTPGAGGLDECGGCSPGFGGRDCEEKCPSGTYSEGGSYEPCTPCGANQYSPPGSTDRSFCECVAGFGAPSRASNLCQVCPIGMFRPDRKEGFDWYGDGDAYLQSAQDGNATTQGTKGAIRAGVMGLDRAGVLPCISCLEALPGGSSTTLNVGATDVKQCVCSPGYGGEFCRVCPPGSWSPGGSEYEARADCQKCPDTFVGSLQAGADSLADCGGCKPGYGGQDCEQCPFGTFSEGGTTTECVPCGLHQTSPTGATSRDFCQCKAGYGTNASMTDGCSICAVGLFWPGPDYDYGDYPPGDRAAGADPDEYPDEYLTDDDDAQDGFLARIQQAWLVLPGSSSPKRLAVTRRSGLRPCFSCADALPNDSNGTTLDVGSTSVHDCVCSPGYGGDFCNLCPPGTWSRGGSQYEPRPPCKKCSEDTAGGQAGASSPEQCGGCRAGTGGLNCDECPPGTFHEGGSYEPCTPCGSNQISPPGAPSRDFCSCEAGFGTNATGTGDCLLCPLGSFWAGPNSNPYGGYGSNSPDSQDRYDSPDPQDRYSGGYDSPDPQDRYSGGYDSPDPQDRFSGGYDSPDAEDDNYFLAARIQQTTPAKAIRAPAGVRPCINCSDILPPGSSATTLDLGADAASACVCSPGYGGEFCELCPSGTWSPGGSQYEPRPPCRKCPGDTVGGQAGASSPQQCGGCRPGTGGLHCDECPPGTFHEGSSFEPCTSCGANQISPAGASSRDFCMCKAGYGTSSSGTSCLLCARDSFWPGSTPEYDDYGGEYDPYDQEVDAGLFFPASTQSAAAESHSMQAHQHGGQRRFGAQLGSRLGVQPCINCSHILPSGRSTTLGVGSTSAKQCICSPGHCGKFCHPAPRGTWSPGGTREDPRCDCRPCPPNSLGSVLGASSETECGGCRPGYGGKDCEACTPGTYSTGGSYNECVSCGPNALSPPAASTSDFCVCRAGYGVNATTSNCDQQCPIGTFNVGPFGPVYSSYRHEPEGPFLGLGGDSSYEGSGYRSRSRQLMLDDESTATLQYAQEGDIHWDAWPRSGKLPCTPCSAALADINSTTGLTGADSPDDCICSPGHCGKFCELAEPGYYSTGGTLGDPQPECRKCPYNSVGSTLPGAASLADCGGCEPGFGGPTCEECPENTWSAGGTLAACVPCGAQQEAPPGSTSQDFCQCVKGTGAGSNGTSCETCALGTYWGGAYHSYGHHGYSRDYDEHESYRQGPYGMVDRWDDSPQGGRYSSNERGSYGSSHPREPPFQGLQPCSNCSSGATTLQPGSTHIHECVCQPGRGGRDCDLCPAQTYSPGGTEEHPRPECIECPVHFVGSLTPGADSLDDCTSAGCLPGYHLQTEDHARGYYAYADRTPTLQCVGCPHDTFSPGGNTTSCTPCGFRQAAPPKSPGREYCQCIVGNGDDGTGNCTVCPLGTFWAGPEKLRFRQEGRDQRSRDYASFDGYSDGYHSGGGYDGSDEYSPDGYSSYSDYRSGYGGGRARVGDLSPPPGVQPCDNCSLVFPDGGSTTLFQGSSSSKDCVCAPGYCGYRCLIAEPGWWSPGGDAHDPTPDCRRCPENTLGSPVPGASDKWDCGGCVPGFGGIHCERCPPNTYSEGGNYTACVPCGANQISPPGSPDRSYCECEPGFGLDPTTEQCELCPRETYSAIPYFHHSLRGHHAHGFRGHERARGGYSIAAAANATGSQRARILEALACIRCDQLNAEGEFTTIGVGSSSPEQCVCAAGHGGVLCAECPAGTWAPGGTIAECQTCPGIPGFATTDPSTGATSPTQCTCVAGHGGSSCGQCPAGTWSAGSLDPCTPCDPGLVSPPGSGNLTDCEPCRLGTVPVNGVCSACPTGTTSLFAGSPTCNVCQQGYGVEEGSTQCTPCPPGTFASLANAAGFVPCKLCPIGRSSAAGATGESQCFCNTPGWGTISPGTDICMPCPVGYYSSPNRGVNLCESCGTGYTTLHPKSSSLSDCVCDAGYGSVNGTSRPCEACISPYYQGILTDYLQPITGATKSNPYPACIYCTGTVMEPDPAVQATGDVNKFCSADTTAPSAYCAVVNITALYDKFSLSGATKAPACGDEISFKRFAFVGNTIERFQLPKNIISMSVELAGGSGAPGFRCDGGGEPCTPATKGGLGGVLTVYNFETVFKGGEEVYILVGGAAAEAVSPAQPLAGGGGGFSAILSSPDPSAGSTVWYAAAGGGGGGAGQACLPNGACVGTAGEGGCLSGFQLVNRTTLLRARPAPKGGSGGAGLVLNSTTARAAAAASGQAGGSSGGGLGGGADASVAGVLVGGFGGGGGGFGKLGAEGSGGFGGGGGGGGATAPAAGITIAPGGGGGGGYWGGAGGDNTVVGPASETDSRVGQGGGGGNCVVIGSAPGTSAQKMKTSALPASNAGNGYVHITVVTSK